VGWHGDSSGDRDRIRDKNGRGLFFANLSLDFFVVTLDEFIEAVEV
jgi:hypothetical protein